MKPVFRLVLAIALLGIAWSGAGAQAQPRLADLNIEDLMNIDVTSASKKAQKISRVPAAIFVITEEDIARSGATNIPDLLRSVPGLEVAQISASSWAVSARGFNDEYSNKLLVLIDGRTVYTPIFSGVYWDAQNVPLASVQQIEIIRGPGATIWGANAVNGVINILTKPAQDTQGATATGYGGWFEDGGGSARYGGKLGGYGTFRVGAEGCQIGHDLTPDKKNGQDDWYGFHAGFRIDAHRSTKDSFTVEAETARGNEGELSPSIISLQPPLNEVLTLRSRFSQWDVLGRWKHAASPNSETSLQVYFDRSQRGDATYGFRLNTVDIDFQQHQGELQRNDLVWGLGYRLNADDTEAKFRVSFSPSDLHTQIFNAFIQDEISVIPSHLYVTAGAKLEHAYYNGFNLQPTARVAWIPSDRGMFWAAYSGAQRTPSRLEAGIRYNAAAYPGQELPTLVSVFGNPRLANERLLAAETGVRRDVSDRLSLDATAFFNRYHDLRSSEPAAPSVEATPAPVHVLISSTFSDRIHGETHGAEVFANVKLNRRWTLSPGYSFLAMHLHPLPGSMDTTTIAQTEGSIPSHQAQLRSNVNFHRNWQWTTSAYFVNRLSAQSIPSYTRLDTNLAWQASEKVSLGIVGQNLVRNLHQEFNGFDSTLTPSLMRRSGYGWLTWRF